MWQICIVPIVIPGVTALAYYLLGHCSWAIFSVLYGAAATFLTYRLIEGCESNCTGEMWRAGAVFLLWGLFLVANVIYVAAAVLIRLFWR